MKKKIGILIAILAIVLIKIFTYYINSNVDYPFISFSNSIPKEELIFVEDDNKEKFSVSIASITSAKEGIIYYEDLLSLLEEELDRPIQLIQRKTYSETNELLKEGEVDLAFICTYSYVTSQDAFGLELLVVPQKDGSENYHSYIITQQDSYI